MHQTETIKHTGNEDDKLFYQTQTGGLQVPWGHILNPHGDPCQPPSQLRGFVHALPSSGNALPYRFSYPSSKSSQVPALKSGLLSSLSACTTLPCGCYHNCANS